MGALVVNNNKFHQAVPRKQEKGSSKQHALNGGDEFCQNMAQSIVRASAIYHYLANVREAIKARINKPDAPETVSTVLNIGHMKRVRNAEI